MAEKHYNYDLRNKDDSLINPKKAIKIVKLLKKKSNFEYEGVQNKKDYEEMHTLKTEEGKIEIKPYMQFASVYGKSYNDIEKIASQLEELTGVIFW